jgi:hypothetical protein
VSHEKHLVYPLLFDDYGVPLIQEADHLVELNVRGVVDLFDAVRELGIASQRC